MGLALCQAMLLRLTLLVATMTLACVPPEIESSSALGDDLDAHCQDFIACVSRGASAQTCKAPLPGAANVCESFSQASERHEDLSEIRAHERIVICHRGSWEFGHENSLEAFRATIELGAEGNEIDIRRTRDGVLVLFHDDFVDHTLRGLGALSSLSYDELRAMPFVVPGFYGEHTRVPTLAEVLDLHRRERGLVHLDIKVPGIDVEIAALLSAFDMWDHVIVANDANAEAIVADPRYQPRSKMVGLSVGRHDVNPMLAAQALASSIDGVFVDDPRAVLLAMGRELGQVSRTPVSDATWAVQAPAAQLSNEELLEILSDDEGWDVLPSDQATQDLLAARIMARARAAAEIAVKGESSALIVEALDSRVRDRGMHRDWLVHGIDGQEALRALFALGDPDALSRAASVITRVDPALEPIGFAGLSLGAVDWRIKGAAWLSLQALGPNAEAAAIAHSYLGLSDVEALDIGFDSFESAALALLANAGSLDTASLLLTHRREDVRARAILELLKLPTKAWASEALREHAEFALAYQR